LVLIPAGPLSWPCDRGCDRNGYAADMSASRRLPFR
jgi:hypothetical protein